MPPCTEPSENSGIFARQAAATTSETGICFVRHSLASFTFRLTIFPLKPSCNVEHMVLIRGGGHIPSTIDEKIRSTRYLNSFTNTNVLIRLEMSHLSIKGPYFEKSLILCAVIFLRSFSSSSCGLLRWRDHKMASSHFRLIVSPGNMKL